MKRLIVSVFFLAGLGMAGMVSADPYKVAVVDVAKILEEAPQAGNAKELLEKEFAPRDRELVEIQKDVRKLEDRLVRDGAIMNDKERSKVESDLRSRKRELKRLQDEFREDLNLRRNQELSKLQRVVLEAIQTLAKNENYDMIVGEGVIYASKRVNITGKVIERLKSGFKKRAR